MADAQRRLRVMADANVLIAGILFPRWFYEFLRHALRGDFTLLLSEQAIREARKRMRMGTDQQVAALEGFLTDCSFELVLDPSHEQVIQNSRLLRDSTDIPIALAAINAGTDYLVTNDKDFTTPDQTTAILRQKLHPITVADFSTKSCTGRAKNWSVSGNAIGVTCNRCDSSGALDAQTDHPQHPVLRRQPADPARAHSRRKR